MANVSLLVHFANLGAVLPYLFVFALGTGAGWLGCSFSRPVPWPDGDPAVLGPGHCCLQLSSALRCGVSLSAPVLQQSLRPWLLVPTCRMHWFRSQSGSSATTFDVPKAIHCDWYLKFVLLHWMCRSHLPDAKFFIDDWTNLAGQFWSCVPQHASTLRWHSMIKPVILQRVCYCHDGTVCLAVDGKLCLFAFGGNTYTVRLSRKDQSLCHSLSGCPCCQCYERGYTRRRDRTPVLIGLAIVSMMELSALLWMNMIRSCLSPLPIHLQNFLAAVALPPSGGLLSCFALSCGPGFLHWWILAPCCKIITLWVGWLVQELLRGLWALRALLRCIVPAGNLCISARFPLSNSFWPCR